MNAASCTWWNSSLAVAWRAWCPGSESMACIKWPYGWDPGIWTAQLPCPALDHRCSEQMCPFPRRDLSSSPTSELGSWWPYTDLDPLAFTSGPNAPQSWFSADSSRMDEPEAQEDLQGIWEASPGLHLFTEPGALEAGTIWQLTRRAGLPRCFRDPARTNTLYYSLSGDLHAIGEARQKSPFQGASP